MCPIVLHTWTLGPWLVLCGEIMEALRGGALLEKVRCWCRALTVWNLPISSSISLLSVCCSVCGFSAFCSVVSTRTLLPFWTFSGTVSQNKLFSSCLGHSVSSGWQEVTNTSLPLPFCSVYSQSVLDSLGLPSSEYPRFKLHFPVLVIPCICLFLGLAGFTTGGLSPSPPTHTHHYLGFWFLFWFGFWNRIPCSPGWLWTWYVAEDNFEFQYSWSWNYRHEPPAYFISLSSGSFFP